MASIFNYDNRVGRYRNTVTGQYVSRDTIMTSLESRMDVGFNQLDGLMTAALTPTVNNFDMNDFQRAFLLELRNQHVQAFVTGAGGRANVTKAMWLDLARSLKAEYRYARVFMQEIANGTLTEQQIRSRIGMYANSVWNSYHRARKLQATEQQFNEAKRTTRPGDICDDCKYYESLDWVYIDDLPLPGDGSRCRSNCRCDIEFRFNPDR